MRLIQVHVTDYLLQCKYSYKLTREHFVADLHDIQILNVFDLAIEVLVVD